MSICTLINKNANAFPAFIHDQVNEQLNAVLKGDGGMIGMTETQCPKALDACMAWSRPDAGLILG